MTDESHEDDDDLGFDEWDGTASRGTPTATAGLPTPKPPAPKPPAPAKKPLYQPPSPGDFAAPKPRKPAPAAPPTASRLAEFSAGFDDDDDEGGATRVADIPDDLIRSIAERRPDAAPAADTKPPPPTPPEELLDLPIEVDDRITATPSAHETDTGPPPAGSGDAFESDAPEAATHAKAQAYVPKPPPAVRKGPPAPALRPAPVPAVAPPSGMGRAIPPPAAPPPKRAAPGSAAPESDEPELLLSQPAEGDFDDDGPELFVGEADEAELGDELDALLPSLPPIAMPRSSGVEDEDGPTHGRAEAYRPASSATAALSPSALASGEGAVDAILAPSELDGDTAPPGPDAAALFEGVEPLPEPVLRLSDLPEGLGIAEDEGLDALLPLEALETDAAAVERLAGVRPSTPPLAEADIDLALGVSPLAARTPVPEAAAPKEPSDQGAAAALRTVAHRKPRTEVHPLVGRHAEALRERLGLLRSLASKSAGATRARLFSAAAELAAQLGEADDARNLHREAWEADPTCPIALRAVRKDAIARRDFGRAAALLEAEADLPVSDADRHHALTLLAELQLRVLGDPVAARASASRARAEALDPVVPGLLVAEALLADGGGPEAAQALRDASVGLATDPRAVAALRLAAARTLERAGQPEAAAGDFAEAREADPSLVEAHLGAHRESIRRWDLASAAAALDAAASASAGGAERAFRLAAARSHQILAADPARAVALLADADRALPLSARADAARAAGDAGTEREALAAWAHATGGTEKAHALVRLAEALGSAGDLPGADQALADAAMADGALGTIGVVREVLARRAGDSSRLARAAVDAEGGGLVAAAKIARDPSSLDRERELLDEARRSGDLPVTADVVGLDAAARAGDLGQVAEALTRAVERSTPEQKLGPLLALADLARRSGSGEALLEAQRRAAEAFPGEPLAVWPLTRTLARTAPAEASALLREEAASAGGERGAHAATRAGRLARRAGEDPRPALREALELAPGHRPAVWAFAQAARDAGDRAALRWLHELVAETAEPADAASHLVRAALLTAPEDAAQAVVLLERALEAAPDDGIVHALMQGLGERAPADVRASAMERAASFEPPEAARALGLRAAALFLDAGAASRAARIARDYLETMPDDVLGLRLLDRAEIAAGEITRVAERRFQAVKLADDDAAKVTALESLAELDRFERGDTSAAVLSLRSILELAPGHLPSLRALETHAMERAEDTELARLEEALARHLSAPDDVAGHLLLAARMRLLPAEASGDAADALLLELADHAAFELGLARRIVAAAVLAGDHPRVARIGRELARHFDDPMERVSLLLDASGALAESEGPAKAAEALRSAAYAAEGHPTAGATLAALYEAAEDYTEAAEAYELAARSSRLPSRAVAMWHAAGVLWQERLDDTHRALGAFEKAARLDVAYRDVYPRMGVMLEELGATRRLLDLTARRVEAGGDAATLFDLYVRQAELSAQLDELEGARQALRNALALGATALDSLRRLAELCLRVEEHHGAAEALIGLARVARDDETLRWVFFHLGDIYDRHIPDLRRAEAAFKRVIKIAPEDTEALSRVADVLVQQGNHAEAVRALARLLELTPDPDASRDVRLRLSRAYEAFGRPRDAEAVLEEVRRARPTDTAVVFAMADLYERQGASSALGMHMTRAIADYRRALGTHLDDPELWNAFAEVLSRRGRSDAARVVAATASSVAVEVRGRTEGLGTQVGVAGAGPAALDPTMRELLSPPSLFRATLEVFRLGAEAFDRALPFDPKPWRAQKVSGKDHPLRLEAQRLGKWFGAAEVQVLLTAEAPRIFMPVSSSPLTVLVGTRIAETTDESERAFLFARAMVIAHHHLAPTTRSRPEDLALAVAGLLRCFDPTHAPADTDPHALEEMTKRVAKGIGRRVRDELGALLLEMRGHPDFAPGALGGAAAELGDHTALLALGSVRAAVSAILKLDGVSLEGLGPSERAAAILRSPEASRLLAFALSDAHFDARRQTGAESA